MVRIAYKALASAIAVLTAACGGGGGDGGGNIQLPVAGATISAQSAPAVASAVVDSLVSSENLTGIGVLAVPSVGSASGTTVAGPDVPRALAATLGPELLDCAAGGTLTISGEIANALILSAGDSVSFAFADCNNGDGTLVDGSFGFSVVSVSGTPSNGVFQMTVSMTLENLQFIDGGIGGSMDGTVSFSVDTTNTPLSSFAVSSDSFSVTAGTQTAVLEDYIVTIVVDTNVGTATLDSSASLTSTSFAGQVSYRTTESLLFDASGMPTAGEIVIEGANNATLTISIVGANQVELGLDSDGNGTVDEVTMTTWAALAS